MPLIPSPEKSCASWEFVIAEKFLGIFFAPSGKHCLDLDGVNADGNVDNNFP